MEFTTSSIIISNGDFFPPEILDLTFDFLSNIDLFKVGKVNRYWNEVSRTKLRLINKISFIEEEEDEEVGNPPARPESPKGEAAKVRKVSFETNRQNNESEIFLPKFLNFDIMKNWVNYPAVMTAMKEEFSSKLKKSLVLDNDFSLISPYLNFIFSWKSLTTTTTPSRLSINDLINSSDLSILRDNIRSPQVSNPPESFWLGSILTLFRQLSKDQNTTLSLDFALLVNKTGIINNFIQLVYELTDEELINSQNLTGTILNNFTDLINLTASDRMRLFSKLNTQSKFAREFARLGAKKGWYFFPESFCNLSYSELSFYSKVARITGGSSKFFPPLTRANMHIVGNIMTALVQAKEWRSLDLVIDLIPRIYIKVYLNQLISALQFEINIDDEESIQMSKCSEALLTSRLKCYRRFM